MAESLWGVNDNETVKHWSRELNREVIRNSYVLSRFSGKGPNYVLQRKDELEKAPGDRIRLTLRAKGTQDGVLGDATLEGNEESMTTYTDNVTIDQLRMAFKDGGRMSRQRVMFDMRLEMRDLQSDLWTERFDESFFNQCCGYTPQSLLQRTGNVAVRAPTANRIRRVADVAGDENLTTPATHKLTSAEVEKTVTELKLASPKIRPLRIDGEPYWVGIIHPGQTEDLRQDSNWFDAMKRQIPTSPQRNPIFTGALGAWDGVVWHESEFITQGVDSGDSTLAVANTRRALFLGAQAATIVFGSAEGGNNRRFEWVEKTFDFGNKIAIASGAIFALQKNQYNSEDFGLYVLTTYSRK